MYDHFAVPSSATVRPAICQHCNKHDIPSVINLFIALQIDKNDLLQKILKAYQ